MTQRMTAAELVEAQAKPKGTKRVQNAQPVTIDGVRFDSTREAERWGQLLLLVEAGEISELERQVPIELHGRDGPILTPTGKPMRYVADFRYRDRALGGAVVIEDAKGHPTEVYKLKRAILAAQGVEVAEV